MHRVKQAGCLRSKYYKVNDCSLQWNGNVVLMKFSALVKPKVVSMTASSTASDSNVVKMTFPFQCHCCPRATTHTRSHTAGRGCSWHHTHEIPYSWTWMFMAPHTRDPIQLDVDVHGTTHTRSHTAGRRCSWHHTHEISYSWTWMFMAPHTRDPIQLDVDVHGTTHEISYSWTWMFMVPHTRDPIQLDVDVHGTTHTRSHTAVRGCSWHHTHKILFLWSSMKTIQLDVDVNGTTHTRSHTAGRGCSWHHTHEISYSCTWMFMAPHTQDPIPMKTISCHQSRLVI